jgi:peptidoglycan/xylan/chitin deacetylase (PgdA/CDA1 family)
VLGYHGIEDPSAFAAQLDRLTAIARPVSLAQVEEALHGGRELPPRSALVTFDDGDRSVLTEGLPLLAARSIPAVCFVIAGLIGTDEPFWWDEADYLSRSGTAHSLKLLTDRERRNALADLRATASSPAPRRRQLSAAELRELEAGGVVVGNHTLTHPCLDRCADEEVSTEILESHDRLTAALGHPPTAFAYPNGNFAPVAERFLTQAGYRTGFLYDHRLYKPGQHRLRISRLRVSTTVTQDRFDTVLSGLQPAVYRAGRGVARRVLR